MRILVCSVFAICGIWVSSAAASVDIEKFNQFVRSELQSVIDQVDRNGTAPVRYPFVADYDVNKDGVIDEAETQPIKSFLGSPQNESPATAVTQSKPQIQSESKPKVERTASPKSKSKWFQL